MPLKPTRSWAALFIFLNILLLGVFLFQYASASYPMVGHDFRLFAARLIDSHLHYKINGLSLQWYTPSFGGGLPAYANPLQAQFSLPQFLLLFMNPWNAILLAAIIYALLGFLAVFFFLKVALGFRPLSAILGAAFFTVNGYFIERVVVGHVNFINFPLIAVFILALLHPKLPAWLAGVLLSLASATLVYSGGVYNGVIGLFSALIIFPLVYFLKPSLISWRRLLPILLWGGFLTLLLCGSKLYATGLYMQNFPRVVRDEFRTDWMTGTGGLIFQLVGVMSATPFLAALGKSGMVIVARLDQWTRTPYGFWELDASLSPVLLLLLALGIGRVLKHKPRREFSWKKLAAAGFLLFSVALVVQFAIAKGPLFQALRTLPVLLSLHANTRFAAAFILPLAILGAKVFDDWTIRQVKRTPPLLAFLLLDGLVLAALWTYNLLPLDVQARTFDMTSLTETYDRIQAGDPLPVRTIVPAMNDYEVFSLGASNTTGHYEPLFRDNNEAFHPEVHEGPVFDLQDGYYNMTNPAGYLFPDENSTRLYERFRESDYEKLAAFVNRRQPDWALSLPQRILDWAALLGLLGELLAVGWLAVKRLGRR